MKWARVALACALAVCAAALIAVAALPPAVSDVADSQDDADLAFAPRAGARLPLDVKVVDEQGRTGAFGRYFGGPPVILALEYLRCRSLCGVTLQNLVVDDLNRLPLLAGRDYQLVALSIDPRDKPADAAAARSKYAHLLERGDASGLHFLTAAPDAAHEIADSVGFHYRYDALLDAYIHPAGLVVVAPDGVISGYLEGVASPPQQLRDAIAVAKQDKAPGLLSRIVLLCHVQGAPVGRYTVPVMAALMLANIAAGLTLVRLFAAIRRRG